MRQNGYTYQAIADEINRIKEEAAEAAGLPIPKKRAFSTIQREYKRNGSKTGKYNPNVANEMAMERRERIVTNRAIKLGVLERAIKLLKEKRWSPEQISGHLRQEDCLISIERIYQEIRRYPELHQYCHYKMKYRHHPDKPHKAAGKSLIPDRVSIHDRPKEADGKRFGDWKMDLVIGKEQKSQVLTLFERSQSFFSRPSCFLKSLPMSRRLSYGCCIHTRSLFSQLPLTMGLNLWIIKRFARRWTVLSILLPHNVQGKKEALKTSTRSFANTIPKALTLEKLNKRI